MTMPHATTTPTTYTTASTPYQTIAHFLDTIYGTQSGQCCLGMIDGDPSREKLREEWYAWPRERRTVVHRLAHLTQRGLNVYTARCLFTTQKRSYATATPSRWLWIDDAPAATNCTMLVQTSEQSYHAWLQLDRAVTADEASQLQRRWRHATGADGCSADGVHMTRVPGGLNTKQHGRFPVTVAQRTTTTYTMDDLPWPEVPTTPDTLPVINLAQVETQRADLRPLLNDQGIPRRFKPHMQSYKVLTGEIVVHNRAGIADQSDPRYWITKGLAYCRYTHEDAYTILLALTDSTWLTQKGFDWHHTDILRCITKAYHEVYAHVARNGQDWQARPVTAREQAYGTTHAPPDALPYTTKRRRRGRPSRVTPADVLDYWHGQACGDRCIYTRKETAHALRISVATLDRHIKHLKDSGTIKIETPAHRQYSVAIFNACADMVTRPHPPKDADSGTIKNTDNASQIGYQEVLSAHPCEAQPDAANTRTSVYRETHPPDESSLDLEELAMLASNPQTYPEMPTDVASAVQEAFGVLAPLKRITTQRIRHYLAENYPKQSATWSTKALDFWIQSVRKDRDWQKQIAALQTMTAGKLKRLDKKISRVLAEGAHGPAANVYAWACAMQEYVAAELTRREPMEDRANPARSRAKHQACIEAVEQDRRTHHRPLPPEQVRVCATVERLRTRKTMQPVRSHTPPQPTGPAQLPRLPVGWTWMFVPSQHMHRAQQPDLELKTKFYHTNEVQHITKEIRRLARQARQ